MKFNLYQFTRKQHACALVFCPANAFIRSPQSFTFSTFARLPHRRRHHCKSNPTSLHYPPKGNPKGKKMITTQPSKHSTPKAASPENPSASTICWNASINEELAAAANVKEGDIVLEIGPGTGSLTNVLVNAGATVLAIEKDPHMAVLVRERFAGVGRVKRILQDLIYGLIFPHYCQVKVLRMENHFLPRMKRPCDCWVLLSVLTNDQLISLSTSIQVDTAVISFKLKQTEDYPRVSSIRSFFLMVNSAFDGKRKMLRKSLQHICSPHDTEAALCNAGLPATSRPEGLTLENFVKLRDLIVKT